MERTRVEFEVTEPLLLDALSLVAQRDPTTRRRLLRMWCTRGFISVFAVGLLTWMSFDGPLPPVLTGSLAIGVVIGLLAAFPTPGKVRRMICGHVAEGLRSDPGYRQLLGWRTIELTADRLVLRTAYAELRFAWHAAVRAFTAGGFFVLTFPGPITAIVPAEAFPHDSDFEDFAREMRRRARAAGGLPDDPADN
jgi:hypothetical protein